MDENGTRGEPKRLDDVIERNVEVQGEELPSDAPILRYVLNVQQHGTSMLAYSLGRGIDVTQDGEFTYRQTYELVKQVKPSSVSQGLVRELDGLTKIYVDHIICIEETNWQLVKEVTDE